MTITKLTMQAQLEDGSIVEVVTPEQVATELGKCLKTVYNWIYGKKVQTVEGYKQVLIVRDSLVKFVESK